MTALSKIISKLIKKNFTISVAESCTGGLISHSITKHNGVSKIYTGGIICYSNNAKIKYLSVSKKTLKNYGSVSSNVAKEMIRGLYKNENTHFCIATTGIAGPSGASRNKPVGLVFIGIKFKKNEIIFKKNFKGSRLDIQKKTRDFVFKEILKLI